MLFLISDRSQQRFFNTPSLQSPRKGIYAYSVIFRPFYETLGFSLKSDKGIVSSISSLFLECSPSDIIGFIVSIVVNSVKRMTPAGGFPNILDELLKRINPLFANNNPPSTMSIETGVIGLVAPIQHTSPRFILSCATHAVRCVLLSGKLFLKASTTCAISISKRSGINIFNFAARTFATPISAITRMGRFSNNNPLAEFFTGQIFTPFCHSISSLKVYTNISNWGGKVNSFLFYKWCIING